jgi:hypothetical protein
MTPVQSFAELHPLADLLNQSLRRFKQYSGEGEWISAILDGAAPFADASALFTVEAARFRLRGARSLDLPQDLVIEKGAARAFDAALEAKDTVVTLRTGGEVTPYLSSPDVSSRLALLPVLNGNRVVAVLAAVNGANASTAALELLGGLASFALERAEKSPGTVQIAAAPSVPKTSSPKLPYWSGLSADARELHLRAHRFARVKVAEMQLFQPDACRAGREQSNVYLFLKKEIDAARESYRDLFLSRPGMEDYLHMELVNSVADGEETKLGVDYPGHLG